MIGEPVRSPVIIVKILGALDGYWEPVAKSSVAALMCSTNATNPLSISPEPESGPPTNPFPTSAASTIVTDGLPDRVILVWNFRDNIPVVGEYYLAFRVGNGYLLDNQASFLEYQ